MTFFGNCVSFHEPKGKYSLKEMALRFQVYFLISEVKLYPILQNNAV